MAKSLDDVTVKDVFKFIHTKRKAEGEPKEELILATPEDKIETASKLMGIHGYLSLPIISNYGTPQEKYHGMVDMVDIVNVVMSELGEGATMDDGDMALVTGIMEQPLTYILNHATYRVADNDRVTLDQGLPDAVRYTFIRNSFFRVTVCDASGHAIGVLSQSDIVAYLDRYPYLLGPKATQSVQALGLCTYEVPKVKEDVPLFQVLQHMFEVGKVEVAVVNAAGKLAGSTNAGALRGQTDLQVLKQTVKQYMQERPQLFPAPVLVKASDSLKGVVSKVSMERAVRAYTVDAQQRPVHVITLNAILSCLINSGWELNNVTMADVIKARGKPPKHVVFDSDTSCGEVLTTLSKEGFISAPIIHRDQFFGMAGVWQIMEDLLDLMDKKVQGSLQEKDHAAGGYQHAMNDRVAKDLLWKKPVRDVTRTNADRAVESDSLADVLTKTFLAHGFSRITVFGTTGQLKTVVSIRDICKFIAKFPDILGERADMSLEALGFLQRRVWTVNQKDTMMHAFRMMRDHKNKSVAVINSKGQLVTSVTIMDVWGISRDFMGLRQMIAFFKSQVPDPEDYEPDNIPLPMPPTCTPETTLKEVMISLAQTRAPCAYIVDEMKAPIAKVTLTDVFTLMNRPGTEGLRKDDFGHLPQPPVPLTTPTHPPPPLSATLASLLESSETTPNH
eukprot:RCo052207